MSNKFIGILVFILVAGLGYGVYYLATAPIGIQSDGPRIDTRLDPVQVTDTLTTLPRMKLGSSTFFFNVKAQYQLKGLVVSTRHYIKGFASRLSPYDFATVWGDVPNHLPYLHFNQIVRYCLFTYRSGAPINKYYVLQHMANNHMIPSNTNIRRALKMAHKGDVVQIDGYLVWVMGNLKDRGTTNWNSSLRRDDSGDGACEIIYVTKLQINDQVYE